MGHKSLLVVLGLGLAAFSGSAVAAPMSAGAASLLTAPSEIELASFWAKPYPHGYRWRITPCYVWVWVEPPVYAPRHVHRHLKRVRAC